MYAATMLSTPAKKYPRSPPLFICSHFSPMIFSGLLVLLAPLAPILFQRACFLRQLEIKTIYFIYSDLDLPTKAAEIAKSKNFVLAGYKIEAATEQLRQPKIVRIGAIQNQIIQPTDAPIADQVGISFMMKVNENTMKKLNIMTRE